MSAPADRGVAWTALFDPATPAEQLAGIAAAYPEFAGQVAQHPNAYPELRAWAIAAAAPPAVAAPAAASLPVSPIAPALPVAQATTVPPVAPAAASDPVGGPASPIPAPRPSGYGPLWFLTFLAVTGAPFLGSVIAVNSPSLLYSSGVPPHAYLQLPGPAMMLIAALIAAPSAGRKLAAALLAIASGISGILSIAMSDQLALLGLVPLLALFLAWGIARPLRGPGYAALAVLIPLEFVAVGFGVYFFLQIAFTVGANFTGAILTLSLVTNVLVPLLSVLLAIWWSRISERRLRERGFQVAS
jgi:hypothetical protein